MQMVNKIMVICGTRLMVFFFFQIKWRSVCFLHASFNFPFLIVNWSWFVPLSLKNVWTNQIEKKKWKKKRRILSFTNIGFGTKFKRLRCTIYLNMVRMHGVKLDLIMQCDSLCMHCCISTAVVHESGEVLLHTLVCIYSVFRLNASLAKSRTCESMETAKHRNIEHTHGIANAEGYFSLQMRGKRSAEVKKKNTRQKCLFRWQKKREKNLSPIWLVYAEQKIHVDYNLWISMRSKFTNNKINQVN